MKKYHTKRENWSKLKFPQLKTVAMYNTWPREKKMASTGAPPLFLDLIKYIKSRETSRETGMWPVTGFKREIKKISSWIKHQLFYWSIKKSIHINPRFVWLKAQKLSIEK